MAQRLIRVTCAVIIHKGRVFAARRRPGSSHALKWEFPGGKVEAGESDKECLLREVEEELQITVHIIRKLRAVRHHYADFSILLMPFVCHTASEAYTLLEHHEAGWFSPGDLHTIDWADADVKVMKHLMTLLHKDGSSLSDPSQPVPEIP